MKKSVCGILFILLLFSSCHSARKVAVSADYEGNGTEVEKLKKPDKTDQGEADYMRVHIAAEARRWIGTPYKYGGCTRSGADCSGFVMTVFDKVAAIKLPRNSAMQQEFCLPMERNELRVADLVFFKTSKNSGKVSHVGIYLGGGDFIHASSSRGVMINNLDQDYYRKHYHSAGRVPALDTVKKKSGTEPREEASAPEVHVEEAPQASDSIGEEVRRAFVW